MFQQWDPSVSSHTDPRPAVAIIWLPSPLPLITQLQQVLFTKHLMITSWQS